MLVLNVSLIFLRLELHMNLVWNKQLCKMFFVICIQFLRYFLIIELKWKRSQYQFWNEIHKRYFPIRLLWKQYIEKYIIRNINSNAYFRCCQVTIIITLWFAEFRSRIELIRCMAPVWFNRQNKYEYTMKLLESNNRTNNHCYKKKTKLETGR